jgi:hypothetical protein
LSQYHLLLLSAHRQGQDAFSIEKAESNHQEFFIFWPLLAPLQNCSYLYQQQRQQQLAPTRFAMLFNPSDIGKSHSLSAYRVQKYLAMSR